MTASVSDQMVAALRAYLSGNRAEYDRLFDQFDMKAEGLAWSALIAAGFFEAVDRRWANDRDSADIVEYVASVRAKDPELSEQIEPNVAEQLILHALGKSEAPDVDDSDRYAIQFLFMAALIVDERLDGAGLDKFLAAVRELADDVLKQQ
ncbi:hypothetical protein Acsp04_05880 [Actinomadura sp. NBRC 104425]|uniref:hypothetical protein n=1 Tax=Actinomadura sp. NBRC 104425 TaxID=3032204 RepID=UPI0024A14F8D|nr:hypothetical protein [Actinomadura sp. NBRC 104425]GLZ10353.1 hypothetical protein Acsp04_05880 [Actinomadura sp. NBRC 104425]